MNTLKTFRLAVAQPLCFPGDVSGNVDRMEPLIERAASDGARLVLFGEGGVTGLDLQSRARDAFVSEGDATCRRLHTIAKRTGAAIVAGILERRDGKIHNTQAVFFPDGRWIAQRKARMFGEQAIPNYQPAPEGFETFEVDGVRCAITIWGDSGIADRWNDLARAGVQVHLTPTAGVGPRKFGFHEAELESEDRMDQYIEKAASVIFSPAAIRTCREHHMVMASCNQMADDGVSYFHPGHSMIVDSTGELAALIPGSFIFEHLRPRAACADVHPALPRVHVL